LTVAVSQTEAQQTANRYLLAVVAPGLESGSPVLAPGDRPTWRMLVRLSQAEPKVTVGVIEVDAQTGEILALSAEQVEDMGDRIREQRGEAAGILRPAAQMRANGYLTNYVSLFAKADRPVWVEGERPRWRATVFLHLRGQGRVCDLGAIEVDAQTGDVIPLPNQQLQAMRKRAQDAARGATPATAAPR
jgi:hypothetical protein